MSNNDPMSKWIKVVEEGDAMLTEMANSRKDAMEKAGALSKPIFEHLLKLFVFESPTTVNHWITEIDGWFKQIASIELKPKSAALDPKDAYNCLIFDIRDTQNPKSRYTAKKISEYIKDWKSGDYRNVPVRNIDKEFVLNKIVDVINRCCIDIGAKNFSSVRKYL